MYVYVCMSMYVYVCVGMRMCARTEVTKRGLEDRKYHQRPSSF